MSNALDPYADLLSSPGPVRNKKSAAGMARPVHVHYHLPDNYRYFQEHAAEQTKHQQLPLSEESEDGVWKRLNADGSTEQTTREQWRGFDGPTLFQSLATELPRPLNAARPTEKLLSTLATLKAAEREQPSVLAAISLLHSLDVLPLARALYDLECIQSNPVDLLERPIHTKCIDDAYLILYALVERNLAIPTVTVSGDIDNEASIVFEWVGIDLQISRNSMHSECWKEEHVVCNTYNTGVLCARFERFLFDSHLLNIYPLRRRIRALPEQQVELSVGLHK